MCLGEIRVALSAFLFQSLIWNAISHLKFIYDDTNIYDETQTYDLKFYDIKATPQNSNLDNVCWASKWGRHEDYRWRLKCFDGKYFQDSPVCRFETIIVGKFNFFFSIIWQFGMVCIKVCKSKIMIIRCIRFKSPCFRQITISGGSLNNYLT